MEFLTNENSNKFFENLIGFVTKLLTFEVSFTKLITT
jgi:hypothetical protein